MLCRNDIDGVDRPFATGTDGARECCDARALYVDGRGVVLLVVMESLLFGMPGVVNGFGAGADFSEMGGDGGVGVSDKPDEDAVLAGGVSNDGEDVVVSVGDNSGRGDLDASIGCRFNGFLRRSKVSSALRSFSLNMSVSILRSENSSLSL